MTVFSKIAGWITGSADNDPDAGADVSDALEWVMGAVTKKVRRFRGDEKKLVPAVRRARQHIEMIVQQTAGPIEVRRGLWATDLCLNTFFATAEVLSEGLEKSVRLRQFFRGNDADQVFALLTMRRTEKMTTGTEIEGNLIKRDVARTAVNFEDHRIEALCPTEAETRRELIKHGMEFLGTAAVNQMTEVEEWIVDLETRRHVLEQEIAFGEFEQRSSGDDAPADPGLPGKIEEGRKVLAEIDTKLAELEAKVAAPEAYLDQLIEVLNAPEKYLDLRTVLLHLDSMNLKVRPDTGRDARQIALTEILLEDGTQAVVVIVKVPREEAV